MSGKGAFFGDEACKRTLLREIQEAGEAFKQWDARTEAGFDHVVSRFNLSKDFVVLASETSGVGPEIERIGAQEMIVDALAPGADDSTIVRRWFLWAWSHPSIGLANRLDGTPARGPATEIAHLIDWSIADRVIPKTWRSARSMLVKARQDTDCAVSFLDVMLTMAWDVEQSPGVAADVIQTWRAATLNETKKECNWTAEDEDAIAALSLRFSISVGEELGVMPENYEQAAWSNRYDTLFNARFAADPDHARLRARNEQRIARCKAAREQLNREMQAALVDLARATATVNSV